MKMYKILRIPDDLRDALDANDLGATTIMEVDVVDADEDWVWVIWPPGQAGVAKMHRRQGWFDTRQEARRALLGFIDERIAELGRMMRYYEDARDNLIEAVEEATNDNKAE